MYADADRFSVIINNKMDDFPKMDNSGDSNSTADQDPVNKVLEKSKKLTEKHAKYTKQAKKQQKQLNEFSTQFSSQVAMLSPTDWKEIVNQKEAFSRSQYLQVRYNVIHQGAPDKYRGKLWIKLLNIGPAIEAHADNIYSKLIEFSNDEVEKDITKDVDRTLAELGLWREDLKGGNNKLYNVLKAYANYDNEVGYVQGLNYIVGLLLFYIPDEEQVFWCLYSLMQKRNWRQVYTFNFPKLKSMTRLLEERL